MRNQALPCSHFCMKISSAPNLPTRNIVRETNTFLDDLLHPIVRKLFLHLKEATLHLQ